MPSIILIVLGVRLVTYLLGSSRPSVPARSAVRFSVRPTAAIFGARLIVLIVAIGLAARAESYWLLGALSVTILLPSALLGAVLIPAGIPYLSYYFTLALRPLGTEQEPRGGAIFNELRTRLRWGFRLHPDDQSFLGGRLFEGTTDKRVRGANLASRAILDALGGDRESARALCFVAQGLAEHNASGAVSAYAQSWLLAEAAQRGAFHEVLALTQYGPRTRRRRFLRAVSLRVLGVESAPRNWVLTCLWLLAPGRRHGKTLLCAAKNSAPRPLLDLAGVNTLAAARRATFILASFADGRVSRVEVCHLAAAWQRVFESGEIAAMLRARRDTLQASFSVETVGARIEDEVIELLARLWRKARPEVTSMAEEPLLMTIAKDRLQTTLLDELEAQAAALPHGAARTDDSLETLWRAWVRIRWLSYEFWALLPERGHLVFEAVGLSGLNHGAWLFNHERMHVFAYEVFRWLHELAPAHDENKPILARNMALARPA